MAIDFSGVRYIVNGEPVDSTVLNRPVQDVVTILTAQLPTEFYNKTQVDALIADESLVNAIIFGG